MMYRTIAFALVAFPALAQNFPLANAVFPPVEMNAVMLGRDLFYDPILSGNRAVACATCHHPSLGTADGQSLGVGDGGVGLGELRRADTNNPPENHIPRNAPALWNLGATEFTTMFHDGRLEADVNAPNGMRTPLGEDMVVGFKSVLSAQAMFPVLSPDEMAGHYSENDVSTKVRLGQLSHNGGAWDVIAARVADIPAYRAGFNDVIGPDTPIAFADIANAIADFIAFEWRADQSPFDQYLRVKRPMDDAAMSGMALFYGDAGCGFCHSGQFQTDHDFHAIAMPQIGEGKAAAFENHHRDTGRMLVTGRAEDAYAFRTPSLRNVTLTAPYGHAGTYATLEGVVRHHLDPVASLRGYDASQTVLADFGDQPLDWVMTRPAEIDAIANANMLAPRGLSDEQVAQIIAFLGALTDNASRLGVPETVPSRLAVDQ